MVDSRNDLPRQQTAGDPLDASAGANVRTVAAPLTPSDILRLPDPSVGDVETEIARANERRLADSLRWIGSVFDPVDPVAASQSIAKPEVIAITSMPSSEELWRLFDDLLVHEDMRLPHLAFELTGATVHDRVEMRASYDLLRPDVAEIATKLNAGAAVLLRWLDEYSECFWRICSNLETITGVTSRVSALITPGGWRPLPQPPPDADRVVVPIDGPIELAITTPGQPERHLRIDVGSAAVVPVRSGTQMATPGLTIVVVIDVGRATSPALVELAASDATFFPLLRSDIPAQLDEPITSYNGSLFDRPEGFCSAVEEMLAPRAFDRAAAIARSDLPLRPNQRLSDLAGRAARLSGNVRSPVSSGVMIAEARDGYFAVAAGYRLILEPECLRALAAFLDGRSHTIVDIAASISESGCDPDEVLDALIRLEILEVEASS